jgi:signal transduction histidine kinase
LWELIIATLRFHNLLISTQPRVDRQEVKGGMFQHLTIQKKFTWSVMLVASMALILATSAALVQSIRFDQKSKIRESQIISELVVANSRAALAFEDRALAQKSLEILARQPQVLSATLYLRNGQPLATFGQAQENSAFSPGVSLHGRWIRQDQMIQMDGESLGRLRLETRKDSLKEQVVVALAGPISIGLGTFGLALLLSVPLRRTLILPLRRLAEVARQVTQTSNYSARVPGEGEDELGELMKHFNRMLGKIEIDDRDLRDLVSAKERALTELAETQQQLATVSRQAGMAEVATGVLHNVGNVLNSINVSSTLIRQQLKGSEVSTLIDLARLVQQHEGDLATFLTADPRGREIPHFMAELADRLKSENVMMLKEHEALTQNVDHIKEIVSLQQSHGRMAGVLEMVSVAQVVEQALRIHDQALTRHHIQVERRYEELPPLLIDRSRVLQILVNLVQNAKNALALSNQAERLLTISISCPGEDRIEISVGDNGVGIPPENLTRIFSYGFSTQQGGHGFGLHTGALAAKEMAGELSVRSEGLGMGALFTLTLPITDRRSQERSV